MRLCLVGSCTTHWASLAFQHDLSLDLKLEREGVPGATPGSGSGSPARPALSARTVRVHPLIATADAEEVQRACIASAAADDNDAALGQLLESFLQPEFAAML